MEGVIDGRCSCWVGEYGGGTRQRGHAVVCDKGVRQGGHKDDVTARVVRRCGDTSASGRRTMEHREDVDKGVIDDVESLQLLGVPG